MEDKQKDLLRLVALALSVGNGDDRPIAMADLHYFAIQVFKQSGFTKEEVKEMLNEIRK